MIKKHFFVFTIWMIGTIAFATSSMSGIKKHGYFDDDKIMDTLKCEESNTVDYKCTFILGKGTTKVLKIINNNECSEFSIDAGKQPGEVILQCGIWGINETYYYQYDSKESNWYLRKRVYEKLPMDGPDDIGEQIAYDCFSKTWSIDDGLEKPKQDICNTLKIGILLQKQYLYNSPSNDSRTKMYLIKGNNVQILDEQIDKEGNAWVYILFKGKKEIRKWIPKRAVESRYRDDGNEK